MKKIIVLVLIFLLCGCTKNESVYIQPTGNISDMTGYRQLETEQFYDTTFKDILKMIDNKETFIVYSGYSDCPWCNCLVPSLNNISIELGMKLYYADFHADNNYFDEESLFKIADICKEKDLIEVDEDGNAMWFFPVVLYVKDGEMVAIHVGTVSGHQDASVELTEKQIARLEYQLRKEFNALLQKN